ncbi:MAG: rod shape-determining protein RodA [Pseudomonadota bacterium]
MSGSDFVRSLPTHESPTRQRVANLPFDPILLTLLLTVMSFGLIVLYSAADQQTSAVVNQALRLGLGLVLMLALAQLPPRLYLRWTPLGYAAGVVLLVLVLWVGVTVKGSQRWLEIPGLIRFQPSELMKLAVPLMVAWYFHDRALPPKLSDVFVALGLIAVPALLIIQQPDLGTGLLVAAAGIIVVLLAGLPWRYLAVALGSACALAPLAWFYALQDYQKRRIRTLFDPESDPLGAGWNIRQSTTAIGSGGLDGKGLFQGTQSHLDFLPESRTDFIIAVIGEELGFGGVLLLLLLYLVIVARCVHTATLARESFERLICGALTFTFFVYVFVNVAMVSGMLPVVGVPLPLISYGGTSAITLLIGFGLIMSVYLSVHGNRRW